MRRVVAVSTGTFFDTSGGLEREDAPVSEHPSSDPYTVTKMAAFEDAMARAAAGQDVVTTHPGAIFGPSPVVSNALGRTSFNRVLLCALRQRIQSYLRFPVSWVFADDIARGCILALDRGVAGERYMLDGRPEDVVSTAEACSRICELAGIDHRVADIEPSDDPELAKVFGATLVAIAAKAARRRTGAAPALRIEDVQAAGLQPDQSRRRAGGHDGVAPGTGQVLAAGRSVDRDHADRDRSPATGTLRLDARALLDVELVRRNRSTAPTSIGRAKKYPCPMLTSSAVSHLPLPISLRCLRRRSSVRAPCPVGRGCERWRPIPWSRSSRTRRIGRSSGRRSGNWRR